MSVSFSNPYFPHSDWIRRDTWDYYCRYYLCGISRWQRYRNGSFYLRHFFEKIFYTSLAFFMPNIVGNILKIVSYQKVTLREPHGWASSYFISLRETVKLLNYIHLHLWSELFPCSCTCCCIAFNIFISTNKDVYAKAVNIFWKFTKVR